MESNHMPTVKPQWRLNPNMKGVVWNDVILLVDVGIIHPISDSLGESNVGGF